MTPSSSFFHNLGIENILLLSAGTIDFAFSALIYFLGKHQQKNIFFALFGISVSAWAFSMVFFNVTTSTTTFLVSTNLLYVFAACAGCAFFFLSTTLKNGTIELSKATKFMSIFSFVVVIVISFIPNFVVINSINPLNKILGIGSGYLLYGTYIIGYFSFGLFNLFHEYTKSENNLTKKQLFFLSTGTFIAIIIGVNTNLIFPFLGRWDLFWFGPVATIFMVGIVGYSTVRHKLFSMKSVTAETVSFFFFVVMLMRLFLSANVQDFIINGILFVLFLIGGYILLTTIYREIETREYVEKLAGDLKIANEHLRFIDKQKSEFVSIASHQLRAPLTAIIGYSSMILEGSYGHVSDKIIETVDKVYQSSRRLSVIIDDFLTISHIEQGKMTYKFETVEMNNIMKSIVEENKPRALKHGLHIKFTNDGYDLYKVTADAGKIRQVLSNLIDNAVKYSAKGNIEVRLSKNFVQRKTVISIKDEGMGLSKESIDNLFQKFSRAKDVQKVYTDGSGIGLYIASEIIKAHHGRIWVESEGEGHGSTFFVELLTED